MVNWSYREKRKIKVYFKMLNLELGHTQEGETQEGERSLEPGDLLGSQGPK